jgi:hypothetical protein
MDAFTQTVNSTLTICKSAESADEKDVVCNGWVSATGQNQQRAGPGSLPQRNSCASGGIREEIIDVVSETGGHLASSLGVVDLTIALHYAFDTPKDRIVWDVGHQAYAHKILTGRRAQFGTLRQHGGMSGFPKREESLATTSMWATRAHRYQRHSAWRRHGTSREKRTASSP